MHKEAAEIFLFPAIPVNSFSNTVISEKLFNNNLPNSEEKQKKSSKEWTKTDIKKNCFILKLECKTAKDKLIIEKKVIKILEKSTTEIFLLIAINNEKKHTSKKII